MLDDEVVGAHPALADWAGQSIVVGIRPENLDDAALSADSPPDRRLRGEVQLREALGSELVVHLNVDARPALTEDVRELAQDLGDERAVREAAEGQATETTIVARFDPHSRIREGEVAEVAVDTRALHFFDPESGIGIYDKQREGVPA